MNRLSHVHVLKARGQSINVVLRKHCLELIVNHALLQALLKVRISWLLFVGSNLSNSSHHSFLVFAALRIFELWHTNQILTKPIQSFLLMQRLTLFFFKLFRFKILAKEFVCGIEVAEHRKHPLLVGVCQQKMSSEFAKLFSKRVVN